MFQFQSDWIARLVEYHLTSQFQQQSSPSEFPSLTPRDSLYQRFGKCKVNSDTGSSEVSVSTPGIWLHGNQIKVLNSPTEFYDRLKVFQHA
jgi:hypothetical protein